MVRDYAITSDRQPVADARADLDDGHLHAMIATVDGVPQIAPGLLAWIVGACDWEQNRRRGHDFPLLPPDAAIPAEENAKPAHTREASVPARAGDRANPRDPIARYPSSNGDPYGDL